MQRIQFTVCSSSVHAVIWGGRKKAADAGVKWGCGQCTMTSSDRKRSMMKADYSV